MFVKATSVRGTPRNIGSNRSAECNELAHFNVECSYSGSFAANRWCILAAAVFLGLPKLKRLFVCYSSTGQPKHYLAVKTNRGTSAGGRVAHVSFTPR